MSYKLKAGQGIAKNIRRIVTDEIDEARHALSHPAKPEVVHAARKSVKRIRSALRLARGAISGSTFKRENDALREIGRLLSEVRDAEVLVESLERIKPELEAPALRRAMTIVRRHVEDRRRAIWRAATQADHAVDRARKALDAARSRAQRWKLDEQEWPALRSGFARIYRQGRTRFDDAYARQDPDEFHAWRKRVKDLRYQVHLLRGVWPSIFDAWEDDLHTLTDLLGDDHDFAVLRLTITQDLHDKIDGRARDALLAGIDRRRRQLESDARPVGERLYAESPKLVTQRIGVYWDTWRKLKKEEKDAEKDAEKKAAKDGEP